MLNEVKAMQGQQVKVFIGIAVLVVVGYVIPSRFTVTVTGSVTPRIYFLSSATDAVDNGDYIQFKMRSPHLQGGTEQVVVKRVACSAGQNLVSIADVYVCNAVTKPQIVGPAENYTKAPYCPNGAMAVQYPRLFLCDGEPIKNGAAVRWKLPNGTILPIFDPPGQITSGNQFVVGDSPDAYDSKYYGLIRHEDVLAKAVPIW